MQHPRQRSVRLHVDDSSSSSMTDEAGSPKTAVKGIGDVELTGLSTSSSGSRRVSSLLKRLPPVQVPSINSPSILSRGSPWLRKPLSVVRNQEQQENCENSSIQSTQQHLHRHLSVWDLIGIGVGGTIGSGIFVLTGQIASQYSGPGTFLSMAIAGTAATCSAVCYAELSCRIPAEGSTYVYAYVCWGELAAVIAFACITLEYGVAGAAVARSWGDKVIEWIAMIRESSSETNEANISSWLLPFDGAMNLPAFSITLASTILLLTGVSESKAVMNAVAALKMILVVVMIVAGFCLYDKDNMPPYTSLAPYGIAGILRGSTTSFFAFLGYDEICCVAGESKNPVRDLPRAILGTLVIVTICYILASIALTGMLPYKEISPTSGFPAAFASRGVHWLSNLTALGEIVTLPVVVALSLLAQPRLLYSMAQDGLLPRVIGKVDPVSGNLIVGTAVSGLFMSLIAAFIPFTYLDDLISTGILVLFIMTNSCLILLRCKHKSTSTETAENGNRWFLESLLILYNILCFITAVLWTHSLSDASTSDGISAPWTGTAQKVFATFSSVATILCLIYLIYTCPRTLHFGGTILEEGETDLHTVKATHPGTNNHDLTTVIHRVSVTEQDYFVTPFVPFLPCFGMAVNWYLIAQMSLTGILLLCLYLFMAIALYGIWCAPYSVGHLRSWNENSYETVAHTEGDNFCDGHPLSSDVCFTIGDCDDDDNENENVLPHKGGDDEKKGVLT